MIIPERLTAAYEVAREQREHWAEIEQRFLDEIKDTLGDEELAEFSSGERYAFVKESVLRFDSATLKADHPELYQKYRFPKNQRSWRRLDS